MLRPLPYREVKRRLEAVGFLEATTKGSHVRFVRQAGEGTWVAIVPRYSASPAGSVKVTVTPGKGAPP
jgi:predicted RNA binding protein YcfA (HicA-like mRNA interferase family)